ncbi:hypothetical protein HK097_004375 [Rhizophlyctis rosea]|uniref:SEC7 domain-containing protein n=1 Tax=Rhizophlyctis rosea TaxID=64517 RepID=A0AAD5SG53_9FUNG|nr:hypothetical protein HK097_004375 [Rhizophlyctis rosea]
MAEVGQRSAAVGFLRRWADRRGGDDDKGRKGDVEHNSRTLSPIPSEGSVDDVKNRHNLYSTSPASKPTTEIFKHTPVPQSNVKRRSFSGKPLQIPPVNGPLLHAPSHHNRNPSSARLDDHSLDTPTGDLTPEGSKSFSYTDRRYDAEELYENTWDGNPSLDSPSGVLSPKMAAPEGYKGLITLERISVLLRRKEVELQLQKEAEQMNLTTLERKAWLQEEENRRKALVADMGFRVGDVDSDGLHIPRTPGIPKDPVDAATAAATRAQAVNFLTLRRRAASASRAEGVAAREAVARMEGGEDGFAVGSEGSKNMASYRLGSNMMRLADEIGDADTESMVSGPADGRPWQTLNWKSTRLSSGNGGVRRNSVDSLMDQERDHYLAVKEAPRLRDDQKRQSGISLISTGGSAKLSTGAKRSGVVIPERTKSSPTTENAIPFRRAKAELIAARPSTPRSPQLQSSAPISPRSVHSPILPSSAPVTHGSYFKSKQPHPPTRSRVRPRPTSPSAVSGVTSLETPPTSSSSSRSYSSAHSKPKSSKARPASPAYHYEDDGGAEDNSEDSISQEELEGGRGRISGMNTSKRVPLLSPPNSRSPPRRAAQVEKVEQGDGQNVVGGAQRTRADAEYTSKGDGYDWQHEELGTTPRSRRSPIGVPEVESDGPIISPIEPSPFTPDADRQSRMSWSAFPLLKNREFLHHGRTWQVITSSTVKDRHLFLFTDVIVIAKLLSENRDEPSLSTFQIKNILALRHAQLVIKDERTAQVDQTAHPVWQAAVRRFASNPIRAVAYLIAKRGIPCTPEAIAHFLHITPNLPRKQVGKFLGIPEHRDILHAYLAMFQFRHLRVDESLRIFLGSFRLPNDPNIVESILEVFARRWYACNTDEPVGAAPVPRAGRLDGGRGGGAGGGAGVINTGSAASGNRVDGGSSVAGELSVDVIVKLVKAIMGLNAELHHPFFSTTVDAELAAGAETGNVEDAAASGGPMIITAREFVDRFRASVRADRVAAGSGVYSSGVPAEMLTEIYQDIRNEKLEMAENEADASDKIPVVIDIQCPLAMAEQVERPPERGSPQPPSRAPFPTRLTLKHSSPVITFTIPEPDPDFRILLHGSDLTCDPPVLSFARSNMASFRVKGTGLGRKLLMFIRQGPRGRAYAPIRTRTITVEPAFLRHSFRIDCWVQDDVGYTGGFAAEKARMEGVNAIGAAGKKKYLFAVADGTLKREWVDAFWKAGMMPRGWEGENTSANAALRGEGVENKGGLGMFGSPPRLPPSNPNHSFGSGYGQGSKGRVGRSAIPSTASTASTSSSSDASISGEVAIRVLKDYILPPDGDPISAKDMISTVLKNAMMPVALGFLRSRLG